MAVQHSVMARKTTTGSNGKQTDKSRNISSKIPLGESGIKVNIVPTKTFMAVKKTRAEAVAKPIFIP